MDSFIDREELKKWISLAREEGLAELELEGQNEAKLSFRFRENQSSLSPSVSVASNVPTQDTRTTPPVNGDIVRSPFVGTFYRSSSPEKEAFVKIGDRVGKGTVLCILEAMKVMNELESEFDGVIREILVDNEELVEFNQPLFSIERSS